MVNSGIILVHALFVISIVLFKIPANDRMFKVAHRQG